VVDLAVQLGEDGTSFFAGLVVGKRFAPDVDTAAQNALLLAAALDRIVVVWLPAGDAPIAPTELRQQAKQLLDSLAVNLKGEP
jgi:hypothetical protein